MCRQYVEENALNREEGEKDKYATSRQGGEVGDDADQDIGILMQVQVDDHREQARRHHSHRQDEHAENNDQGSEFRDEDFARQNRKAGQGHTVAKAREEALPLQNGEERGNRHGQGEERKEIVADGLAIDLEGSGMYMPVALPVDLERAEADRAECPK